MAKYGIILPGKQELDVVLRSRLTQSKMVIESLIYRKYISAEAALAIRAVIDCLTIGKAIAGANDLAIESEIASFLNEARFLADARMGVLFSDDFYTAKYFAGNETALAVDASVAADAQKYIEARAALGLKTLAAPMSDSFVLRKYFRAGSGLSVGGALDAAVAKVLPWLENRIETFCSCALSFATNFAAACTPIEVDSSASFSIGRLRYVNDMDDQDLDDFDAMTISDIDYIIVN